MQQYKYTSTLFWDNGWVDSNVTLLSIQHPVSPTSIAKRLPGLEALSFVFGKAKFKNNVNHFEYLKNVLNLTKVEFINIEGSNQLTELPAEILKHPLKKITITNCPNLKDLSLLGDFMELEEVQIIGEHISLPASFFKLPILEKLIITGKSVDYIDLLPNLMQLQELSLNGFTFEKLPEGFEKLAALRTLRIANIVNLTILPSLKGFKKLEEIRFSSLPNLKEIPNDFEQLSSLKNLNLHSLGNNVDDFVLPASIGENKTLENFMFSSSKVKELMNFEQNKALKFISLNNLKIKELPISVQNLSALTDLMISHCGDFIDSKNIGLLKNIQRLTLSYLPNLSNLDFLFSDFSKLLSLNLEKLPEIEELPAFGVENSFIKQVHLRSISKLKQLPESLMHCINLAELIVRNTAIKSFSESLKVFQELDILRVTAADDLKYFPSKLFHLGTKELQIYTPHVLDGSKMNVAQMVKIIRKTVATELQETIAFWLFNNFENEELTPKIRQQTMEALSCSNADLQMLLSKNLYRLNTNSERLQNQLFQKGDKITILGTTQNKRTFLRQQMEALGFVYSTKLKEDVRFVLFAKKPKVPEDFWQYQRVVFSENEFMGFQKKENPGFLQQDDTPPDFLQNLRRLIWSNDPVNEGIALEMVTHNGMPESMDMDFIVVAKTSKDKSIRNRTRKFLKGSLSEGALKLLNDRTVMLKKHPPFYAYDKYVSKPKIGQIAAALYQRTGVFLEYFFRYDDGLSPYRREMFDAILPSLLVKPKYLNIYFGLTEEEFTEVLANPVFKGNLTRVVFRSFILTEFPKALAEHETIKDLSILNEFESKELPAELFKLKKLNKLNLSFPKLETVSPEIGKLVRLQQIMIYAGMPVRLPESFINLKKLKSVCFSQGIIDKEAWQKKMIGVRF